MEELARTGRFQSMGKGFYSCPHVQTKHRVSTGEIHLEWIGYTSSSLWLHSEQVQNAPKDWKIMIQSQAQTQGRLRPTPASCWAIKTNEISRMYPSRSLSTLWLSGVIEMRKSTRSGLRPQLRTDLITCWQQSGINYEGSEPIIFGNSRKIDSMTANVPAATAATDDRPTAQTAGQSAAGQFLGYLGCGEATRPTSKPRIMIL